MSNDLLRIYVRAIINEGPRGTTGAQVGAPYRGGRFALGWGTGMNGSAPAVKGGGPRSKRPGGYPSATGGSTIKMNRLHPYSDEFVDDNETKRQTEFDARASEFMGAVDSLKKALSLARTTSEFDDAMMVFFGDSGLTIDDVLDSPGAFDSLIRNGETQKARHELIGALDGWARKRVSSASLNDDDSGFLDGFGADASSFKQTISGMYRWS